MKFRLFCQSKNPLPKLSEKFWLYTDLKPKVAAGMPLDENVFENLYRNV